MELIDSAVEAIRLKTDIQLDEANRGDLGQFMTNWNIAKFMSSLVKRDEYPQSVNQIRILDPGAGVGSLSAALVLHLCASDRRFNALEVTAFEIDQTMRSGLTETGVLLESNGFCHHHIVESDFIEAAVDLLDPSIKVSAGELDNYDFVILNPPYKKISSSSLHRQLLRKVGIEATNLYTAFWQLSILLAKPGAQICAIVPRSFCNGTYFSGFRKFLKLSCDIHHIHVFDSRKEAFSQNDVLQENVIFHCIKKSSPSIKAAPKVVVSRSADDSFSDLTSIVLEANQVWDRSKDNFIFIPTTNESLKVIESIRLLPNSLEDLGLKVSTGPVVQFRLRPSLSFESGAPMIYCSNMKSGVVVHNPYSKKSPPFIRVDDASKKWLVANSCYLVIRRFSSKEEKRRIVCAVHNPGLDAELVDEFLGIDNKLNYFYSPSSRLTTDVAHGLFVFLSSTFVDSYYRLVSGHTQVNSGDLRSLKYPSLSMLKSVGASFMRNFSNRQESIDSYAFKYFDGLRSSNCKAGSSLNSCPDVGDSLLLISNVA